MTTGPAFPRRIAHFDLDSFFVAVETARNPALRGKPVLVGHPGGRGVVATASYEARKFGCHSAQPMVQALRLCPQAIVVPPDFEAYSAMSERFHAMLRELSPVVESVGIDEAYVDFTGVGDTPDAARALAERVRTRVREDLGVTVSACIAGSRTTAKVGSDRAKPDGLLEIPPGGDAAFLAPLPIRDLPLVGPKLGEALAAAQVRTIGDAAALDPRWLEQRFGRAGVMLAERARGIDPTPVEGGGRPHRSISREVTFGADVTDLAELRRVLARHAERVGADLRASGKRARTVTLKLRWHDFTTLTRSRTLERPVRATLVLVEAGETMLDEVLHNEGLRPVRLLGLGVTNLVEDVVQLGLDDANPARGVLRDERLDETLDSIRGRFGRGSVRRGLGPGERP
ncbi:MAG: DNA polymerase IV [Chloroflexi bacterium]|nr:DNA polymerase IV [Chloroflexota bacterium]MDA1003696.1 DNA polymerase IV [Chloroflexota bacterium]